MNLTRRKKSTPARAASLVGGKLESAGQTAKDLVVHTDKKDVVKRLPWIASAVAAVVAAVAGVKVLRGGGGGEPATG
jgi:ElaB/YqjD/DUF883 family membrane-anchored ribosome-binding protein